MELVTLPQVRAAAEALAGVAVRTPLLPAGWSHEARGSGVSGGPGDARWSGGLWLKPESLQPTGAFKLRGAYHALSRLPRQRRAAGVVTHSSGNHGQALAWAARAFGVPCVVVMPDLSPPHKIAAVRRLGAEVELVPPAQRAERATALAAARGLWPVPPFDHPDVIAGQGTVGLEIVSDLAVDVVLVPVGGGGLASGVATAVTALAPRAAVIGVEPELAADARDSLAAGELRPWPAELTYRTVADGLRTQLSELTLAHLRARLAGMVTVGEDEILETAGVLLRESRLVVEPSGAVAAAAFRHRRAELPVGRTVAVVSGGNADPALLARLCGATG